MDEQSHSEARPSAAHDSGTRVAPLSAPHPTDVAAWLAEAMAAAPDREPLRLFRTLAVQPT